jgi:integrase
VRVACEQAKLSERHACGLMGMHRASWRYRPREPNDAALRVRLRELAAERVRFGSRRLWPMLRRVDYNTARPHSSLGYRTRSRESLSAELFALGWPDIDFERQTIQISRSCYRGEFGLPKTARSRRVLVMPPLLSQALQEHRERTRRTASDLVFSTREGKPLDPSRVLRKAVQPVLKRLEIPRVGWRAFHQPSRHSCSTWACR